MVWAWLTLELNCGTVNREGPCLALRCEEQRKASWSAAVLRRFPSDVSESLIVAKPFQKAPEDWRTPGRWRDTPFSNEREGSPLFTIVECREEKKRGNGFPFA